MIDDKWLVLSNSFIFFFRFFFIATIITSFTQIAQKYFVKILKFQKSLGIPLPHAGLDRNVAIQKFDELFGSDARFDDFFESSNDHIDSFNDIRSCFQLILLSSLKAIKFDICIYTIHVKQSNG